MDHRSAPAEVKTTRSPAPSYFLLAVSTRLNLDLCIKHALAGFTNSLSGFWTFMDVQEGDLVSFLYGARAYNLYRVERKLAYKDAETLPPWPPLVLQPSGRTYNFPFRLELKPVRTLDEPLVRAEFAYVAENLLLRGGYRKTHFQADQTTLQYVSQLGVPSSGSAEPLEMQGAETFIPHVALGTRGANPPYSFPLRELIVQSLLRKHLSVPENLRAFLTSADVHGMDVRGFEVLGEKAFPEGHIDLLIKESTPMGISRKVVVEVKLGAATGADIRQLHLYMERLGEECAGGILVAGTVGSRLRNQAAEKGIACVRYVVEGLGKVPVQYDRLLDAFILMPADA